jgi:hypothetical protein
MEEAVKTVLIESFRAKYHRGSKKVKGAILTELCEALGVHRKHAIRLLNPPVAVQRDASRLQRGRKSRYDDPEFLKALRGLWMITDQMGPRLLHQSIPAWLPAYERRNGVMTDIVREKLLSISHATIERKLRGTRAKVGKGRCGTKPGNMLRNEIPLRTDFWDVSQPGFVEADTVAHCGGSLMGEFIWSLTVTDICTTWTEMRVTWNKGAHGVLEQIQDIEAYLPFELMGFDCDNGSEFLNHHLLRYFTEKKERNKLFTFTRSRPYHKDDNAHVEQKNWSHPRQLLGYERLAFQQLVAPINDLCRNEYSLLKNHFYPTFKLDKKIMVKTRHRRIYGKPITPYQRVLESVSVPDDIKDRLRAVHETLDPVELQLTVRRKLKNIWVLLKQLRAARPAKVSA